MRGEWKINHEVGVQRQASAHGSIFSQFLAFFINRKGIKTSNTKIQNVIISGPGQAPVMVLRRRDQEKEKESSLTHSSSGVGRESKWSAGRTKVKEDRRAPDLREKLKSSQGQKLEFQQPKFRNFTNIFGKKVERKSSKPEKVSLQSIMRTNWNMKIN